MDRLPDEILLLIVDNIVLFKDKYQFLLVCRRWRSVLFKAVYDYVWIEGSQIRPLLLAIQENPAIGSSIKDFRLHWWSSYTREKQNHDITSVLPLVNRISQSEAETKEWEEALIEGNQDAWLGLLLLTMENMTSLLMHYTWGVKFFNRVLSRAAMREKPFDTMPILQHLEDVGIDSSDDNKAWYPNNEFLPFFHLPSVRSVSLDSVVESMVTQIDHPAFKPAKGTSPIVELEFGVNPNGSKGMADFITSCANLENFKFQHSNQVIWGERYMNFRPRAFYSALSTQKHSLQVLHLNDRGETGSSGFDEDVEDGDPPPIDWFGPMVDFTKLWDLRIPVATLLNFHLSDDRPRVSSLKEILPPSLKYLAVTHFESSQTDQVMSNMLEVVACRKEKFPHLEEVEIQTYWSNLHASSSAKEAFTPLVRAGEDAGVDILVFPSYYRQRRG
ncbi:hypothetical protein AtubIFM56815_009212 [Aspergillus tubingensis]|uniref:Uncharacterized protein n=1 Tax=Aspergillus tubingensis TaxID=5068 RepID=A0A8H3SLV8_ASPTU|nr:fungal specific transcription factor domain family protein [Aspergillus tubingensis]GFN11671.1 fungal specific transcription factor domain family protein [Aspergillus tubingensis]GLA84991.1 hypothetical protein AtubIFM56815_009212 [Aspergillus tubingensis]GLA93337.1 hypothetical protein AtubIFM57143_010689 [Aspergillus tubingensis]GLB20591.1 hypothetical protein AtubIFM61612_010533 [Aspergillus tubingensis]